MLEDFSQSPTIIDAIDKAKPSRALWNGTVFMREQGEKYLKKSLYEKTQDGAKTYKIRLDNAVLKNKYKSTINYILGQIFRKPLILSYTELKQELIDFFETFKEDVDNKGNDINVFLKDSLKNGLIDGVSFVVIDTQNFKNDGKTITYKGKIYPNTIETEKKLRLRPYWLNIKLENIISVKVDWVDGKKQFTEFAYKESILQEDNITYITRVYKYSIDKIQIWELNSLNQTKLIEEKANEFGFIPLSIFMCGEPISDYTAIPTLTDLAELNIAHYNAYSEHQSLMRYDRNPLWLAKSLETINPDGSNKEITIGPGAGLSGNEESDLKSVGVDSQSVVQSMQDLENLEKAMDEYTSSLTSSQNMTAEQVSLISSSSNNQIKNWATIFKDFIEDLLCNTSIIKGYNKELGIIYPDVIVNDDYRQSFNYQQATLLQDMVSQGQLSNETFLEILKKMSVFDDDFDISEEMGKIGKDNSNIPVGTPEE